MEDRILKFFRFLYEKQFDGSICFHEKKFKAYINFKMDGKVLASGEGNTPLEALDDLKKSLDKVGFL